MNSNKGLAVITLIILLISLFAMVMVALAFLSGFEGSPIEHAQHWRHDKFLELDGDAYIEVDNHYQISPEWTACTEVYLHKNLKNEAHVFFDDSDPTNPGYYSVRFSMQDETYAGFTDYTIKDYYFDDFELQTNRWKFVCFVGDNDETRIYVDGEEEKTEEGGIKLPIKWIGNSPERTRPHGTYGIIREVIVYDETLSDDEIEELYEGIDIETELVHYWPMNEGEGDTVYDESENNNHGTIHGDASWKKW